MVKAHLLDFKAKSAPFLIEEDLAYMRQKGIQFVANGKDYHVAVTEKFGRRGLFHYARRPGGRRPILIWTDEPRYDTRFKSICRGYGLLPDLHVMNVYTGDVFVSNYRFARLGNELPLLTHDNFRDFQNKKTIALMTYREGDAKWSLKRQGHELDLCTKRCRIALEGYRLGTMDICGQHWPSHVKIIENSRRSNEPYGFGTWWERKRALLSGYHFNLAMENTIAPNYTTEKFWDSIACGCLPIYTSEGNRIYNDLPRNSFLDYDQLGSPQRLFDKIQAMTPEEFRQRMNACIDAANRAVQENLPQQAHRRMLDNIVERLHHIATGQPTMNP